MRLVSFLAGGRSSFGAVLGDGVVDLGARFASEFATLKEAIAADALDRLAETARGAAPDLALGDLQLLPPIVQPDKIVGIGRNYRGHAAEIGAPLPAHPVIFLRLAETLIGGGAAIRIPPQSSHLDFEGELAVIIGKAGRSIPRERAFSHVAGYACFNDASLRDIQFEHSLIAGKNFPATGGFGPWLTTADEVPNPTSLVLTTRLNGDQVQHSGLDDLIFDIPTLIEYISAIIPLAAGDVIATGTPEGVGFARKPPLWMKEGDVIEVEISGLGILRNDVAPAA